MSKTKTIEGVEYIQKDHVDEIVRQRIAKYSEKLTAAESKIAEFESQLDEAKAKSGLVDNLTAQLESMKGELNLANNRYDRHSIISQHGITDSSIRDAIEWAFDRQMDSLPKKDRVGLGDWLSGLNENPESAPAFLRPFFGSKSQSNEQETSTQSTPSLVVTNANPQTVTPTSPPPSNNGVQSSQGVTQNDLLSRAHDTEFFQQNREAIREAYYASKGGKSPYKF